MTNPRVDIILPLYNRAALVGETLQTVLAQTYADWELWVVDDGSTDSSVDVIRSFHDSRIHILQPGHGGQPRAMNYGVEHSSDPLVAFIDSDDLWLPDKLEKQIPLFDDPEVGLVYSNNYRFDENGRQSLTTFDFKKPLRGRVFRDLCLSPNPICASTVVVRRDCFARVGLFNDQIKIVHDIEMWLRIATAYEFEFCADVLAGYRFHAGQSIHQDQAGNTLLYAGVLRSMEQKFPALTARFAGELHRAIATLYYVAGREAGLQGQWQRAQEAFASSLRTAFGWRAAAGWLEASARAMLGGKA